MSTVRGHFPECVWHVASIKSQRKPALALVMIAANAICELPVGGCDIDHVYAGANYTEFKQLTDR